MRSLKCNTISYRHIAEFLLYIGMPFFYTLYRVTLPVVSRLIINILPYTDKSCGCCTGKDLELIGQQFPFEPLQYQQKNLRLPFEDGIKMLQEAGYDVSCCAYLRAPAALLT